MKEPLECFLEFLAARIDIAELFKQNDACGNGMLEAAQLRRVLVQLDHRACEFEDLFAVLDVDGSGKVDWVQLAAGARALLPLPVP